MSHWLLAMSFLNRHARPALLYKHRIAVRLTPLRTFRSGSRSMDNDTRKMTEMRFTALHGTPTSNSFLNTGPDTDTKTLADSAGFGTPPLRYENWDLSARLQPRWKGSRWDVTKQLKGSAYVPLITATSLRTGIPFPRLASSVLVAHDMTVMWTSLFAYWTVQAIGVGAMVLAFGIAAIEGLRQTAEPGIGADIQGQEDDQRKAWAKKWLAEKKERIRQAGERYGILKAGAAVETSKPEQGSARDPERPRTRGLLHGGTPEALVDLAAAYMVVKVSDCPLAACWLRRVLTPAQAMLPLRAMITVAAAPHVARSPWLVTVSTRPMLAFAFRLLRLALRR